MRQDATPAPDDQREAIAFLSEGAAYGAPGAAVDRIVTHCSMVFLVGDHAYKLKRAVAFSYLDYSTLALRERYCRAELALNRRTAPELYLGLRAVTCAARGGLAFDAEGPVLDWVVEMQRFGADDLFDHMAAAHRLTPALMRGLADIIADFHQAAEITSDQGGYAGLRASVATNSENLRLAAPPLDQPQIDALHAASMARLALLQPLLEARRDEGKVRRCHGDLHLRNVCLFRGRPTLFDCIEFNDAFACIDVLYDIAFLLMDLVQRGLGDLANLVFNRYLDRTGDIAGLPALPLFLSVRAAVRAHVIGALARGGRTGGPASEAQSYLALALRLLEEHGPQLIAIGGRSGSGKSVVAQALAPGFRPAPGARVVRSDAIRKRMAGVSPETRLPPASYTPSASREVYHALGVEAAATLAAGYSAIVDATFLRPDERRSIAALARERGVPFTGLWLEAPANVLAARLGARRNDASDADRMVLERQLATDTGTIEWQRVDASGDVAHTVAAARRLCGA